MKKLVTASFLSACLLAPAIVSAGPRHAADEHLGKVEFPATCAASTQPLIDRGAALLHSFQYLQSENTFSDAVKQDPKCALAHWGKAMALYHQLWDFPQRKTLDVGRKELNSARKLKNVTPREKQFIETAAVFFQNKKLDEKARIAAYSAAMEKWYATVPGDAEVGSFYALSLVALAYHEDAAQALELRRKAIGVLNSFFEKNPDHPGVAHYLIHAADEQSLAPQGLAAARRYAAIAPESSHAIHMPSHIFVRLGMWQDSITSNIAAQAAGARAAEAHQAESHYQTHAMDFLNYSYLQSGQLAKAEAVIADEHHVVGASDKSMKEHMDSLNERMVMELHRWKDAANLPAENIFTKTVAAARSGDLAAAHAALAQLQAEAKKHAGEQKGNYTGAADNEIQLQEAEAWVAFAEGKPDDALKELRAAANSEDSQRLDSFNVTAREMLAEMLLEAKRLPTRSPNTRPRSPTPPAASICSSVLAGPPPRRSRPAKLTPTFQNCWKPAAAPATVPSSPKPARWPQRTDPLEVEAQFGRVSSRRHKVCSAEGRKKVVQSLFIGQIDRGKPQAPLVAISAEKIVVADGKVE